MGPGYAYAFGKGAFGQTCYAPFSFFLFRYSIISIIVSSFLYLEALPVI
jgi:hypothetical protein